MNLIELCPFIHSQGITVWLVFFSLQIIHLFITPNTLNFSRERENKQEKNAIA